MSTPNTTADKFVMLFSADWFRPYWSLYGFVPKAGSATAFQTEMRDAVNCILEGATCYWDVNFSEPRLRQSRDALLGALDRHSGVESKLGFVRELVEQGWVSDETLAEVSMAFWGNDYEVKLHEINRADFEATEWDRRLTALTPDVPTMVQDFALAKMCGVA